jgi:hypothetical protein
MKDLRHDSLCGYSNVVTIKVTPVVHKADLEWGKTTWLSTSVLNPSEKMRSRGLWCGHATPLVAYV